MSTELDQNEVIREAAARIGLVLVGGMVVFAFMSCVVIRLLSMIVELLEGSS